MTVAPDWYIARGSWLHRADARVKLAMVICGLVVFLSLQNASLELVGLLILLVGYRSAGLPLARVVAILKVLLPVSVLMAVLRGVLSPQGTQLAAWGWLKLTDAGLASGAALGLRLLAAGLLVFLWLHTTRPSEIIQSLVRLGLPYSWGLTLALALRFVPILQHAYQNILDAQQARGLVLGPSAGPRRVRVLMPVFVAMVISGFRTSEQVALALEARGLESGGGRRSVWRPLRFRPVDAVYLAVILGVTGAWLGLHFARGIGADPLGWW